VSDWTYSARGSPTEAIHPVGSEYLLSAKEQCGGLPPDYLFHAIPVSADS
jgi:hypothetical protein